MSGSRNDACEYRRPEAKDPFAIRHGRRSPPRPASNRPPIISVAPPRTAPMPVSEGRKKIITIAALGSVLFLLLIAFTVLNAFKLKSLDPSTTGETVILYGLSAVAFLLFMAVLVLLTRNLLKLYADQRASVMGTRLRTRMLWGAVIVSLIPLVFMFLFSYGLMNRAVDRWFSTDPEEMRNDARQLALDLKQYTSSNARVEAESIAASLQSIAPSAHRTPGGNAVTADRSRDVLADHEITLQNGFAVVYSGGHSVVTFHLPQSNGIPARVKTWLPPAPGSDDDSDARLAVNRTVHQRHSAGDTDATILAAAQRTDLPIFSLGGTDYALGIASIKQGGTVVVGLPVPYGISGTVASFQN